MKRSSPTGLEVRIRFIVMFFLVCGQVVLVMFGKRSFLGFFLGWEALEPVLVMRRAEAEVITRARDETLIVQLCAEVPGVDVVDHLAWVSRCAQETPGEFIHSDRFGTGDLDRTV